MSMRIFSTATNGTDYVEYYPQNIPNQIPRVARRVKIKGGANRADKKTIVTPMGVATEVTEDELAFLQKNAAFNRHLQAGFIQIVKTDGATPEKVVKNMEQRDGSSPNMPQDYEKPPVVDAPKSQLTTAPPPKKRQVAAFRQ